MSSKIKLLEIEPVSDLGGVTYFIFNIISFLPINEFDIHFAASGNGEAFKLFEQKGVITHRVDIDYSVWNFFSRVLSLRSLLEKQKIDIIHAHTAKAGLIAVCARYNLPTKMVFSGHGWRFPTIKNPIKKGILFLMEKCISINANAVTYLSKNEQEQSKKISLNIRGKIIPISLNVERFKRDNLFRQSIKGKYYIPEEAFVVGVVGRVVFQKDPKTFIKAASLISRKIPEAFFVWVGEGDLKNEIIELVTKLNLKDKFIFMEQQPNNKIPEILQIFDVFLFTSLFEGLPICLLEAMAARLSIVASEVGGVPEVIFNKKNGLLFKKSDYVQAAENVIMFYKDKTFMDKYASEAFDFVKNNFSPEDKCSKSFSLLYYHLINK